MDNRRRREAYKDEDRHLQKLTRDNEMLKMGLRAIFRSKRFHTTDYQVTVSDGRIAENLLKRDFTAEKLKQKWVTDNTQYSVLDQKI